MVRNLFFTILLLLFLPLSSWAAILYLEPTEGEYYRDDIFIMKIRIDTEGECINTVKADISFPQDVLQAIDFSQGDSILTLWLSQPEINQSAGLVSFIGGVPGGYCGRILGDPGFSDLLGKIIFKVTEVKEDSAEVRFLDTSQVLLNDGLGTEATLNTQGAVLTLLSGISPSPKREWQEEIAEDTIPPEAFEIEIVRDPGTFGGKYFITFVTVDKQTGLDYFEVKEGQGDWQRENSPYLLKDQNLQSKILIQAIDKAGNKRIIEYTPSLEKKLSLYLFYLYSVIVLILLGLIWWFIRRRIKKQKSETMDTNTNSFSIDDS